MYAHLLNQSVTISGFSNNSDDYGNATHDADVTYKARVEQVTKQKVMPSGEIIPFSLVVWIMPTSDTTVDVNARVIYNGAAYKVIARKLIPGFNGTTQLFELECTEWRG
jgi:hypothetical protein